MQKKNIVKISVPGLSVLGYREDGDWVAHALEMDVIGVGDTWEEALSELDGNIHAQIAFAKDLGDDSLIFRPAPAEFFDMFKKETFPARSPI